MSGEDLLALYRKRGKAEGHLGLSVSVVSRALSSTSRRKSHYRGRKIAKRDKGVDPFACNQLRLLLPGFGYRIMHVQRAVLERATGTGWSLRRLAERVLRVPARFTVSGRRITIDHRRRVGALAHPRPRARDPARALRIARPPPGAETFPGPGGRKDAEVSPSAGNRRSCRTTISFGFETPVLGSRPARPAHRGLREAPQPPHTTLVTYNS